MKIINFVNVDKINKIVWAIVDDYFRAYSLDPEIPETEPRLCIATYSGEYSDQINFQWSPVEPDYEL